MQQRGRGTARGIRLTAVCTLVVLSLTGFSTSRGHGHHGSGSGGGCSSSHQDHDTSSGSSGGGAYKDDDDSYGSGGSGSYGNSHHDYDDDNDTTGGSSGSSGATATESLQDATARLVSCATKKTPYATVEVTNPNATEGFFAVTIHFRDAKGEAVRTQLDEVDVPANGTVTVREYVGADEAARVDHCDLEDAAPSVR
ncbi:hypothetical protein C3489_01290 [Streptomyces sp. Ru71]|uniref:hypothetical protein n=1 Tax=Streptomyces sp. Ru71 TaxID=2080746 RepID=UPI000CDE1148|nr:hypothetical protein [Streptomyces sp. Ru71]POX56924.1 hypothetical protein C3489_01290 [Streptomyces sp. Ru71]